MTLLTIMKRRPQPPKLAPPLTPCNVPTDRCSVPPSQAFHRILIMRLGAHGDILMGTPLLAALRQEWPDAHLTWIVEHSEQASIDANPYIDEIIVWEGVYWKKMLRRGLYPLWLARALAFQRKLRRCNYDIFISFQPEEWTLLVQGVGAPVTVGVFDTFRQFDGNQPTSAYTRFYTHAFTDADLPLHRTDQYLLPLKALGLSEATDKRMSLGYTVEDNIAVNQFFSENGMSRSRRLVVLAPMTTWPSRCWPEDRYAELGDMLSRQMNCQIVVIGSAKERKAVESIASQMSIKPLMAAGIFTFRQMAALIGNAALLVSGDTGPMHVAAAVGTPYLSLFGPTPVDGRAPLLGRGVALMHPVPCGPCDQKVCPNRGEDHMRCMRLLTVAEVGQAASELLTTQTLPPLPDLYSVQ